VSKNQTATRAKVTAELSTHLEDSVSTKISRRELHKAKIHGKAANVKLLISENNAKRRKRWCDDHKTWTSDEWKYVTWSEASSFTLYQTSGRVYIWKAPKETYNLEWLVPTVKHEGGSVMIWVAISWYFAGLLMTLNGRIIASDYTDSLRNQVHPMIQMFPNNALFQDDNSPIHSARNVQSWFREHEDALKRFSGQHNRQN
jgi:hypothetical protein